MEFIQVKISIDPKCLRLNNNQNNYFMKTKVFNVKGAKALQRNEMKIVNGGAATAKCCEWGEGPKGQRVCLEWAAPNGVCR